MSENMTSSEVMSSRPGGTGIEALPGVDEQPEIVEFETTCRICGSRNAVYHYEKWPDGFSYSEWWCRDCGCSEVL